MSKIINVALCESRHKMPAEVGTAIFANELTPEDLVRPTKLEMMASASLSNIFAAAGCQDRYTGQIDADGEEDRALFLGDVDLHIYVTGLTVALIAALNACRAGEVGRVVLHHYDRNTAQYYEQEVL